MKNLISLSTSQLTLSSDKKKLLLSFANTQENITAIDITNLIKKSIYKDFKINKKTLNETVKQLQNTQKSFTKTDELVPFIIAQRHDAELIITIDPSEMYAKAQIISAYGGKKVTKEQLIQATLELGIKAGINDSAIELLLEKSSESIPGTVYKITIATGKPPINGHNAFFSAILKLPKENLIAAIIENNKQIDMDAVENIISINPGTPLIRKFPHKSGQEGFTVTGKILTHTIGRDIPFYIGKNTKISDSDPNLLVSTIYGVPLPLDIGMDVEPALVLENLPNGGPAIDHNGPLIIKGDVPPGTKIKTTGDLTVIGFIESSEVSCDGDLFVADGILSERNALSLNKRISKIDCAGSIYTNFIQYSIIKTGKNLDLQRHLIHSEVLCGGYIKVENKEREKGTIFGGRLCAHKGINTVVLGANSGVKTVIDLNTYYSELMDNDRRSYSSINQIKEKIKTMVAAQTKLNESAQIEKTMQLLKRLRLTLEDYKNRLTFFQNQRKDNENKIRQYFHNTNVNALKTIYSDVSVCIGKKVLMTKQQYGATTIRIKSGKLIAESYRDSYKR